MAGNYLSNPNPQFLDLNGDPVSGGAVEFLEAGSTTTDQDTFTDKDLTPGNENPNPVILGSDGRPFPDAAIFLQQLSYNVRLLAAPGGSEIWARDNVSNITQIDVTGTASVDTYAALTALLKATLTDGTLRQVNGRNTAGDIEPVIFQFIAASTATANAGTILATDEGGTGRWLMLVDGPFLAEWFNAKRDGTTDDTIAIQALLGALGVLGGGTWRLLVGTYFHDTLNPPSNIIIEGEGVSSIFKFIPHATTGNAGIELGDASAGVENVILRDFSMDGQKATQTGGGDNFSHSIRVWGSNNCKMERLKIFDPRGDGILLGQQTGRLTDSSDNNIVDDCEIFGQTRQAIALTYGNENKFINSRISGTIDIEIDAGNFEAKNNLVDGNSGRIQTENLTVPRISDLKISTATLNTDPAKTSGNIISNNTCFMIQGQVNDSLKVINNTVIGSETTENFLMDFAACNNLYVEGNELIANVVVATALTALVRTRAGDWITMTGQYGEDGGLPFHNFASTFGGQPNADNHNVKNNFLNGGGDYRTSGSSPFLTEESVYKIETDGATPQVFTFTQISGPDLPLSAISSANNMSLDIGWASGSGLYQVELFGYGEIGTGAEPFNRTVIYTIDISGSARIINVFTATLAADPVFSEYNFASGGTLGTLFIRLKY